VGPRAGLDTLEYRGSLVPRGRPAYRLVTLETDLSQPVFFYCHIVGDMSVRFVSLRGENTVTITLSVCKLSGICLWRNSCKDKKIPLQAWTGP
jgi:hypothetical protein